MGIYKIKKGTIAIVLFTLLIGCGGDGSDTNKAEPSTQETTKYNVSGNAKGVATEGLVISLNSDETLSISQDQEAFEFTSDFAGQDSYDVQIMSQPQGLHCQLYNGAGVFQSSNVTDLAIECHQLISLGTVRQHEILSLESGNLNTDMPLVANFNEQLNIDVFSNEETLSIALPALNVGDYVFIVTDGENSIAYSFTFLEDIPVIAAPQDFTTSLLDDFSQEVLSDLNFATDQGNIQDLEGLLDFIERLKEQISNLNEEEQLEVAQILKANWRVKKTTSGAPLHSGIQAVGLSNKEDIYQQCDNSINTFTIDALKFKGTLTYVVGIVAVSAATSGGVAAGPAFIAGLAILAYETKNHISAQNTLMEHCYVNLSVDIFEQLTTQANKPQILAYTGKMNSDNDLDIVAKLDELIIEVGNKARLGYLVSYKYIQEVQKKLQDSKKASENALGKIKESIDELVTWLSKVGKPNEKDFQPEPMIEVSVSGEASQWLNASSHEGYIEISADELFENKPESTNKVLEALLTVKNVVTNAVGTVKVLLTQTNVPIITEGTYESKVGEAWDLYYPLESDKYFLEVINSGGTFGELSANNAAQDGYNLIYESFRSNCSDKKCSNAPAADIFTIRAYYEWDDGSRDYSEPAVITVNLLPPLYLEDMELDVNQLESTYFIPAGNGHKGIFILQEPSKGKVTFEEFGLIYTPNAENLTEPLSFDTFKIASELDNGEVIEALITVNIIGLLAPEAYGSSHNVDAGFSYSGIVTGANHTHFEVVNTPSSGTLAMNSQTGEFTYTAFSDSHGKTDQFTFKTKNEDLLESETAQVSFYILEKTVWGSYRFCLVVNDVCWNLSIRETNVDGVGEFKFANYDWVETNLDDNDFSFTVVTDTVYSESTYCFKESVQEWNVNILGKSMTQKITTYKTVKTGKDPSYCESPHIAINEYYGDY
ncbi:hypothetical protein [Thalassotalea crassostreae]|uniref:hypothetical protein n=1 Tax=Thalassotalea crassostreae TaxID=1763536 RepID=UPI00083911F9|nr:hypothetical protein [Thalassotalea crassostreae]